MAQVRKVLIVGGGIGGLSAASAIRKAGVEVDLIEINESFVLESSLQIGEWEQRPSPDADPAGLTRKMFEVMAKPI